MQLGLRAPRRESEVPRPAFRIEAGSDGKGLHDRRLSGSVLADEEGGARVEPERLSECRNGRD